MTIHLVRHASAGDRSRWADDDLERPLDARGHEMALAIDRHFTDLSVTAVFSSMAIRCIETVAPMALSHGLDVEQRRELTEGARPNDLLELMRSQTGVTGDVVMCSHGDLIPEALNRLLREGMSVIGPRGCEKGSVWSLEVRGRDIVAGRYTAQL